MVEKYFANMPVGNFYVGPLLAEGQRSGKERPCASHSKRVASAGPTSGKEKRAAKIELTAPREQTVVLFGFPGLAVADKRMDACNILLAALNGLSSDLMINVRDKRGLAYYTGAYQRSGLAGGQMVVYAGTRLAEAQKVGALIEKEMKRLGSRGIRPAEFECAKKEIITQRRQNEQSDGQLALECALNELYGLGYAHGFETEKRLEQITADEVRRVAAEIVRLENAVEVTVKPEKGNAAVRR
jgi:zinc protease